MKYFFCLLVFFILGNCGMIYAQESLQYTPLVDSFYKITGNKPFWFDSTTTTDSLRDRFIKMLSTCATDGLSPASYDPDALVRGANAYSGQPEKYIMTLDRSYTNTAISFFKDLYGGIAAEHMVSYDELSEVHTSDDDRKVLTMLSCVKNSEQLLKLKYQLEPQTITYILLKEELARQLAINNKQNIMELNQALNCYRWIFHFHFDKFIIVNIAAGFLQYFEQDSLLLTMKVVAGKMSTKTPRFAAYCNQVILYPYWNVPRSIAVNEILPFCKKNLMVLDAMNLQVIDDRGNIITPGVLNWKNFSKENFPYHFRQSTGCDNALGVIKFNLTSPYSVYLHDTNLKSAFASDMRYYSHGCIRIEKPIELANYILTERLDSNFLNACIRNQKPIIEELKDPVPVFSVYMTIAVLRDSIHHYPDVYNLF